MRFIDSHTEGEPTRVILDGGPDLGNGTLDERLKTLSSKHDEFRKTVILEPRGTDAIVGALLCPPTNPDCATGVIYFNNTGYLGMCGHGTIGVAATLAYLGRAERGTIKIETPVGVVQVELSSPNEVTFENVPSYRLHQGVELEVPELGVIRGDVAWGGNWFFLAESTPYPIDLRHEPDLASAARRVKDALTARGITGENGAEIDHIEFFSESDKPNVNSRNYVLCPGDQYDRSPCGTGTSAKLACLAEDNKLDAGAIWVQESVIGSRFEASYRRNESGEIIPSITGRAYVCGEGELIKQPGDPFANGIAGS